MKLEEMLSEANRLFGVSQDVLNAKVNEQVVLTVLDKIDSASKKVHDVQVTQEFAIADIELEVVADYNFVVLKYSNLIDFAGSLEKNAETYAKGKVIERLKLAKERLQEVEILYLCNSCEVSDKDPVKKAAMDVALNRVTEYIGFLNTRLKLIAGNEVIEKVRKLGRVEQRTEPTHTQPQRTDTGKVLGKAKKGKEVLCFEIGGEQYYRISEIADMFKTSISALHQYIGRCVDDKERTQLERDGKEKDVIYKGKRSGVYSFDIFETILPKKYHHTLKDTFSEFTPKPASQDNYHVVGEERSIDKVVKKVERTSEADEGAKSTSEPSSESAIYYEIRGQRYYSAPESAKFLGVDYSKLGYNLIPNQILLELEQQGKVKAVKREKGNSTKVYREDALVGLLPEKVRESVDSKRKSKSMEYDGKYKAVKLADNGTSVCGYRPQPLVGRNVDNSSAAKVEKAEAPKKAEGIERTERVRALPAVQRKARPETTRSPQEIPVELGEMLSAKGLEQTVEGAETLYFLAINGQRYFKAKEVRKVYSEREYDGQKVPSSSYPANICILQSTGKLPEGTYLKVEGLQSSQGKTVAFVREDYVQPALPKYVDDQFSDLIKGYSLSAISLVGVDVESLTSEMKKYGLYTVSKSKRDAARQISVDSESVEDTAEAESGLEAAAITAAEVDSAQLTLPQDANPLIPYDDLPSRLGYSMGDITAACELLVSDGKLKLEATIPELGDDSPKGIRAEELVNLTSFLKETQS